MNEVITWRSAKTMPPDADLTVLAFHDHCVFLAYIDAHPADPDGHCWRDCASGGICEVTYWANVHGPREEK